MRQVIIQKNSLIKELSGSKIELSTKEDLNMIGSKVNRVKIPFKLKILAGGTPDFDFKPSKLLAENGVSLLGAYWDGEEVIACFMPLEGTDVEIDAGTPILTCTMTYAVTFRQASAKIVGGVVNVDKSGDILTISEIKEEKRSEQQKKTRKPRKKT